MPAIMPYNSAFVCLSRVRDRFHDMKDQMKTFPVAPLSSMTPTFVHLDKVGLQHSMAAFRVLPNQIKPKNGENSRCN